MRLTPEMASTSHSVPAAAPVAVAVIGHLAADVCWPLAGGYGRKYVTTPQRRMGGYPAASSRQLLALKLEPMVVSARGPDLAGAFLLQAARKEGLSVESIRLVKAPTREAQIIEHGGERTIMLEKRPFARLQPTDLDDPSLASAALWCAGGSLDDPRSDNPVLERLLRLARELGKPLCLNPSRVNALGRLDLSGVSLVQVSSDDREALGFAAGASAAEVADAFLRRGAATVIVTAGPGPVRGFTQDGQSALMPAAPVATPAYPTGAGDCVSAVHAWALVIERFDLCTALDYGVAAGALWVASGRPASAGEIRAMARSRPPAERFREAA
jgi:sugar/nucleoside kinase (ribokinase family)